MNQEARHSQIIRFLFFIFPILLAWVFLPQASDSFAIKNHLATCGILIFGLVQVGLDRSGVIKIPWGGVGFALASCLIGFFISISTAIDKKLALNGAINGLSFIVLFISLINLEKIDDALTWYTRGIIVAASGISVVGLKQYLFPLIWDFGFRAPGKLRVYSTLGNPTFVAIFFLTSIPLTFFALIKEEQLLKKTFLALSLLLQVSCFFMTQSKHAFFGLLIQGGAFLWWACSTKDFFRSRYFRIGISLGALIVFLPLFLTKIRVAVFHSMQGRLFIWLTSLKMIEDNWLIGRGLSQYAFFHLQYQAQMFSKGFSTFFDNAGVIVDAHNQWLNYWVETGIFGLVGFLLICGIALIKGRSDFNERRASPVFFIVFLGLLAAMMFNTTLFYAPLGFNFWLAVVAILQSTPAYKRDFRLNIALKSVFILILGAALTYSGACAITQTRSSLIEGQGDQFMQQKDKWLALKKYQQARDLNPRNGSLLFKIGSVYYLDGRYGDALNTLKDARKWSGYVGVDYLEAELLARLNRFDEAIPIYRQISLAFPNHVNPHFMLGQIFLKKGLREKAEMEFKQVLDIRPSPFNIHMTREKVEAQKNWVREYFQSVR